MLAMLLEKILDIEMGASLGAESQQLDFAPNAFQANCFEIQLL
jgi:hypothetical protein